MGKRKGINKAFKNKKAKGNHPVWTLEEGVTYSGLSLWMQCPEQFSCAYVDGHTPRGKKEAFEFGNFWHHTLEHQFQLGLSPEETAKQVCESYCSFSQESANTPQERDKIFEFGLLTEKMFPLYCEFWGEDDASLTWKSREEKFSVTYDLPTEAGPRTILLRGMRDGVYSTKFGQLGIFETKTKSKVNEKNIHDELKADLQTFFYATATELETGITPSEVLYNVIRRPQLYRRKGEELQEYVERVIADVRKRPQFYFMRWEVKFTKQELEDFKSFCLNPYLRDFVTWWDSVKKNPTKTGRRTSPYHRVNYSALFGKYGRADMYDAVLGRTATYKTRSVPFPELEPSTLAIPEGQTDSGKEQLCLP